MVSGFIALSLCGVSLWLFWHRCLALYITLSLCGVPLWLYRFLALSLYRFLVCRFSFIVFWCLALSLYRFVVCRFIAVYGSIACYHYYTRYIHVFAYVYVLKPSLPLCLSHSLSLSPSLSASPSLELCICFGSYIGRAVHASVQNEMVCSSLSLMLTYGSACPGRRSCRLMMHASIYSLLVFFLGAVQLV